MTDTAIRERDESIADALASGRSMRVVQKEFGLNTAEFDAVLERLYPIDTAARIRMIKSDLGKLDRLTEVFYSKALSGDVQSGLLMVRLWERKHELLGMNSAARIEIIQAPPSAPIPTMQLGKRFSNLLAVMTAHRNRHTEGEHSL